MSEQIKTKFQRLYEINVNDKVEKKQDLSYLSWAYAWKEFKNVCPDATYTLWRNTNGAPYFKDECGYMVGTSITADGLTYEMWLPVMNHDNKAMKEEEYQWYDKYNKPHKVNACSMFDVNKTIMRCLAKNVAMFGLGLYIYAGEDIPNADGETNLSNEDATFEYNFGQAKNEVPPEWETRNATPMQILKVKELIKMGVANEEKMLEYYGIESIDSLNYNQALEIISKRGNRNV